MFSSDELRFVESQRVGHLGTADASGRPHVMPVCFTHLDGHIYIAIDEKRKQSRRLKRLRNIEENPQVALVLDRYDDDWSRLGWVLVQGMAAVLDAGPEHGRAIEALRDKYQRYREMALEERPVICVKVERVSSWSALA